MARALELARAGAVAGEVPVGAVLVRDGRLLAEAHNETVLTSDPTAHAEVVVIRAAAARQGDWRLEDTTLYVTLEPCTQCAGAIVLARIPRVVYGATDPKAGMVGSLGNLLQDPRLNHRARVTQGVLEEASSALLRGFFLRRRRAGGRGHSRILGVLSLLLASGCAMVGMPLPPAPTDLPPLGGYPVAATRVEDGFPVPEDRTALELGFTPPPLPPLTLPAETGDVRALWVVRTALLHPDSARVAVRRAHEAGFNTLLVQVRGRGDAYYDSRWEPRPDPLGGSIQEYDPLQTVLDEAHRLGLRVHAWMNVHLVASASLLPRSPEHLARARPELLAVPRALASELFWMDPRDPRYLERLAAYALANADRIEGVYTNPAHLRVQDHLYFVVVDLLDRYRVDGIHFDYIRFPSEDFDYSRATLEDFRLWAQSQAGTAAVLGAEGRWPSDPLAYVSAFPNLWGDYRRAQVTLTMERLYRAVKGRRPDAVVSAAVFADAVDARRARFQDWELWLDWGIVDVVAPMAYTANDAIFQAQIVRAASLDPRRVWAGIGIYQNTFAGGVSKARFARSLGVGGVALFSYDWAAGPEGSRAAGGQSFLRRYASELWGP